MEASTSTQNHGIEEEGRPLQIHEIEEVHDQIREDAIQLQNNLNEEATPLQVTIDAVWLSLTEIKTTKPPKLLNISAASTCCSIFRVPQTITKLHSKSFQPALVSVGPYYHGQEHLQMIEEHKWRILRGNLDRLKDFNVTLCDLFKAIAIKEKEIRDCYSENIDKYTSHKLLEMMILDGCFIIELLCVAKRIIFPQPDDPIFNFPWMLSAITKDLLMLENQIPFFVLQILYSKSVSDHFIVPPLQELILTLFDYSLSRSAEVTKLCQKYKDYNGQHILDFYRWTFIPSPEVDEDDQENAVKTTTTDESQSKKGLTHPSKKLGGLVGIQCPHTLWSRCCCQSVRPSPKKEEISGPGDSLQWLSKEQTIDARDQGDSGGKLYENEETKDARDQRGSGEKLPKTEGTTDATESFQLIQPVDSVKKLAGLVRIQFPPTQWSCCSCCCLCVGTSSKKEDINNQSDPSQSLSKEETTEARDLNKSSSRKETTVHIKSLQSLPRKEETADGGNLEEDLSKNKNTTEAKDGVGNQFKKWLIYPVKTVCGFVMILFKKKADADKHLFQFIQPVEKLREAGIKFKKHEGKDSFLDIDFSNGTLRIPLLITSETMSTVILNCIALEQCCKHRSKHFTSYFNFMGYLINTTADAAYLRKKKIIENFSGTDQELVSFFNEVGKNIPYYFTEDYLKKVSEEVEIYYRSVWHVRWAEFKYKYCGSLWIIMSACAAVFVILLATMQAVLALYKFIKHSK